MTIIDFRQIENSLHIKARFSAVLVPLYSQARCYRDRVIGPAVRCEAAMTRTGCGLIVTLIAALIATNGWWALRDFNACDNFLFHEVVSPNGKSAIFLFYNNCGATTAFTTQAVLQSSSRPFSVGENRPFLVVKQLHALDVRWLSDAKIEVLLPKGEEIYRQDRSADGVAIAYRR